MQKSGSGINSSATTMHGQNQHIDQKETGGCELTIDRCYVYMYNFLLYAVCRIYNVVEC
jgi:hypothetical protein